MTPSLEGVGPRLTAFCRRDELLIDPQRWAEIMQLCDIVRRAARDGWMLVLNDSTFFVLRHMSQDRLIRIPWSDFRDAPGRAAGNIATLLNLPPEVGVEPVNAGKSSSTTRPRFSAHHSRFEFADPGGPYDQGGTSICFKSG